MYKQNNVSSECYAMLSDEIGFSGSTNTTTTMQFTNRTTKYRSQELVWKTARGTIKIQELVLYNFIIHLVYFKCYGAIFRSEYMLFFN